MEDLKEGTIVRVKPIIKGEKRWKKSEVIRPLGNKSYEIQADTGICRRNRVHLRPQHSSVTFTADANGSDSESIGYDDGPTPGVSTWERGPTTSMAEQLESTHRTRPERTHRLPRFLEENYVLNKVN